MDNLNNNLDLASKLLEKNIFCTDVLRMYGKNTLQTKKLNKGETVARCTEEWLASWNKNKILLMYL